MASITFTEDVRDRLTEFSKLLGAKAYAKFLCNVRAIGNRNLDIILRVDNCPSHILAHAFVWEDTPEGYGYWRDISVNRLAGSTFDIEPATNKDSSTGMSETPTTQRNKSLLELAYEDTERQRQEILNRLRR